MNRGRGADDSGADSADDRVSEVLAAWRDRVERGEAEDEQALLAGHPDLASELMRRLEAERRVAGVFGGGVSLRDAGTAAREEPPPPSTLTGRALGPYRLGEVLGTGGMGTVYAATVERRVAGLAVGDRVAVKVVHPHLLHREGFFKRFVREAETGRRIRHENLVRTLDADAVPLDGGHAHFLVMEHVEGQTLRDLLEEVGRVPEDLCRHVGREVARALAAIHAAGIVHRDLKPENVIISRCTAPGHDHVAGRSAAQPRGSEGNVHDCGDHVVKVMDLGVARWEGEELRLSQTGAFVGSVRYAAPEQFGLRRTADGDASTTVDARADLYALGLVLYELATGAHPFAGDDFHVLMKRQLTETPRPAGEVNPQLSPFFEEILRELLEKEPDRRLGSAEALLAALEAGEKSPWWHERAARVRVETKRPLRRIRIPRETALYGREAELAKLRAVYDLAKSGDGQVVVLDGEAGIGKSRLVDEFVGGLQREGEDVHFLFGSYPPGGAATASGAFSTAYREHFGEAGLEEALRECLPMTPLLVPAFAALLRGDAAPAGAEALTKDSLQTVFVHATRSLAAQRTTIVLIDDLHFAPEEGRALFASLALATPGHRILLVGTARPGLPADLLVDVERTARVTRLPLPRLGPKDLVRLLADTLKSERLAEELSGRIAVESDGNPFFVFEILRGLREGQFLTQRPDGTWVTTQILRDIQVPSTIQDLVRARIGDLDAEDKDVLDVAACLGFEFDAGIVAAALGSSKVPVLRRLARIEARHRLVRSAGERFVFDHHQVQEALYGALPPPLAREYHGAIADAIERTSGAAARDPTDVDGVVCVELCEHFLDGGQGARALRYLGASLQCLERAYLNDRAVRLADRVLVVPGLLAGRARVEMLLRRNERLDLLGRRESQRAALEEAQSIADLAGEPALRARTRNALGAFLAHVSRGAEAEPVLRAALDLARGAGDLDAEAAAVGILGIVFEPLGRHTEARECQERRLTLARQLGDRRHEVAATLSLGNLFYSVARYAEAQERYERGLALALEIGHRRAEAAATGGLANVLGSLGRHAEAQAHHERSLVVSREIGDRRGEAITSGNLGIVLHSLGRFAEAREFQERQLALSQEIGDRRGEANSCGNLAGVLMTLGRYAEAREHFERQLALSREIGDRRGDAVALANLGQVHLVLGDAERARRSLDESLALSREVGARYVEGYALVGLATVAVARDEGVVADRLLGEVLVLRREIGDSGGVVESLLELGDLQRRAGDVARARETLEEAIVLARVQHGVAAVTLGLALLANLPGGDVPAAAAALRDAGDAGDSATVRLLLWQATGDRAHLTKAKSLLDFMVEHAPPECRESMLTHVRLHREILAAAREHLTA